MERIFNSIPDRGSHHFFWRANGTKGGAKFRDLSSTSTNRILNANGSDHTPFYNSFNLSAARSHFWRSGTGFQTGKIDRASNSSPTARNSAFRSSACHNSSSHSKTNTHHNSGAKLSTSLSTSIFSPALSPEDRGLSSISTTLISMKSFVLWQRS